MGQPIRMCIGCRGRAPAAELVRVAWLASRGGVVVDQPARIQSRGAWLHPDPDCLRTAQRKRAFGRALRRPVGPDDLADVLAVGAGWVPGPGRA